MKLQDVLLTAKKGQTIVYDGDLVGWTYCSVVDKHPFGDYTRANVITEDGTKLYRLYKEIEDFTGIAQDGSIYKLV